MWVSNDPHRTSSGQLSVPPRPRVIYLGWRGDPWIEALSPKGITGARRTLPAHRGRSRGQGAVPTRTGPPLGLPVWRCSHLELAGRRCAQRGEARPYLQVLHLVLLQGPQRVEMGQAPLQGQLVVGHPVQGHEVAPTAVVQGALQHQVLGQAPLQAGVCRAGQRLRVRGQRNLRAPTGTHRAEGWLVGKRRGRVLGTDPDSPPSSCGAGEPVSLSVGVRPQELSTHEGLTVPGT